MTVPVRTFPEPAISLRHPGRDSNSNMDATVRRAVPNILLQLSRGDERPTAPAPFWVARVDAPSDPLPLRVVEPEPRQTTPSIVKLAPLPRPRRRWVAMLSAAAILVGGAGVASVFADAEIAAVPR